MSLDAKYYIVEASALPEVFLKVAEAKRLLSSHEAATVNDATQAVGISRSAFYKYRDAITPLQNMMHDRVVTFQFMLRDEQGLLSNLLNVFAESGANILTINSIRPTDGTAIVTISAETRNVSRPLEELVDSFNEIYGVLRSQILAG